MNEESKEVEKHFIGVKTRIDSDAEFFFFEEMKHGHDIKHNSIRSDEIEAKVILISDPPEDYEDYEIDLNYNEEKQRWTCTMFEGTWLVVGTSKVWREIN